MLKCYELIWYEHVIMVGILLKDFQNKYVSGNMEL